MSAASGTNGGASATNSPIASCRETLWRLHGSRPANHPQRRLALAVALVSGGRPRPEAGTLVRSRSAGFGPCRFAAGGAAGRAGRLLVLALHLPFRPAQEGPAPAGRHARDRPGGQCRPALALDSGGRRARTPRVQRTLEHRYFAWPAAEDNSVLRLARQRLLGDAPPAPCPAPPPSRADPDGPRLLRSLQLHLRPLQTAQPGEGLDRPAPLRVAWCG